MEDDHSFLRPKMVFPSYDGSGDPLPWINRCELYFRGHNTLDHRKVWMASLHLTDAAQLWYYRLEMVQGEPEWRRFCQLVNCRFDSHSLLMGSTDMVIGVSWLSLLGDIQWNFREQTFGFRVPDKRIMWCGIERPSSASFKAISTVAGQLLPKLL